jgi:glucosamine 6-phosphate synthetase-like amidotransferase/phosphosugar isomerase protein
MSITDDSSVVWFLGPPPANLYDQTAALGAIVVAEPDRDPLAELIRVQRLAVGIGAAKGLDPDNPRNLTRSVVLPAH